MGFLGVVPSERTSGSRRWQGGTTKTGNGHLRRLLVEAAWYYRRSYASSKALSARRAGMPEALIAHVDGRVHTNSLENFWSLLKRCINGTWVSLEPFHLFRYLDEQSWRFNHSRMTDRERFTSAIRGILGRRLTYNQVRGKTGRGPKPGTKRKTKRKTAKA